LGHRSLQNLLNQELLNDIVFLIKALNYENKKREKKNRSKVKILAYLYYQYKDKIYLNL